MDSDGQAVQSGSLGLQISNAIGRLHKEFTGRGPTKVRTYVFDNLVACVLEGGLTRAEHTVRAHSGDTLVMEMRLQLQAAMGEAITEAVANLTGRKVRSFMSANDPDADLQVEFLLLANDSSTEERAGGPRLRDRRSKAIQAAEELKEDSAAVAAETAQVLRSLASHEDSQPGSVGFTG